jgi:diguanylate cyclase (GGDEF)-like protein
VVQGGLAVWIDADAEALADPEGAWGLREHAAITDIALGLLTLVDRDDALDYLCDRVAEEVPGGRVAVLACDRSETPIVEATAGWPDARSHAVSFSAAPGTELHRAFEQRRPVVVDRTHPGEGFVAAVLDPLEAGAAAVLPIVAPGLPDRAVVAVASERTAFGARRLRFLSAVASGIGAAAARWALESDLRDSALHDPLTGLANRVALLEHLEHALKRNARYEIGTAVFFLDLDEFKEVNDVLGHASGDELLRELAQRLGSALRRSDMIARFGGDEFVILCESLADRQDVTCVLERIGAALAEPFILGEGPMHVTASVGVAVAARETTDVDTVMKRADLEMYRAKEQPGVSHSVAFDV